jgi:predicted transcriptional regulator
MPKINNKKKRARLCLCVLPDLPEQLDRIAHRQGLSRSRLTETIIAEFVGRCAEEIELQECDDNEL